jgi:putative ubiquitin-RnfH superfamily antitoxin RatB of RatAB toxin-antitoxin module
MVKVELVFVASDKRIFHRTLTLADKSSVADALEASQIKEIFPEVADLPVGIYAQPVSRETLLREGDRVEIYRRLSLDPKDKRRQRAKLRAYAQSSPKRRSKNKD